MFIQSSVDGAPWVLKPSFALTSCTHVRRQWAASGFPPHAGTEQSPAFPPSGCVCPQSSLSGRDEKTQPISQNGLRKWDETRHVK